MPINPDCWEAINTAEKLNWLSRGEIESVLASIGIQSYEAETTEDLRQAILCNIEDGTLDVAVIENMR